MARKLPKKDVVIIGLGWTGADHGERTDRRRARRHRYRARSLARCADGLSRRHYIQDELRYRIRHELFLRPDQTTFTFRNKMDQTALPIRSWGAFMPPNGVGGGGVHWNAETWRFLPSDFVLRTHLTERYGASFLPQDMTIQDYGVTYDELEPHYDRFEYLCGTSGTAGNLRGKDAGRRQSIRGRRARGPIPRRRRSRASAIRCSPRRPRSSATNRSRSRPATCRRLTPIRSGCAWAPAPIADSASGSAAATIRRRARRPTILPVLIRKSNFSARDNAEVTRINTDRSGKTRHRRHLRRHQR